MSSNHHIPLGAGRRQPEILPVGLVVPFEDKHSGKGESIEKLVSLVSEDMERVNGMILSRTGS